MLLSYEEPFYCKRYVRVFRLVRSLFMTSAEFTTINVTNSCGDVTFDATLSIDERLNFQIVVSGLEGCCCLYVMARCCLTSCNSPLSLLRTTTITMGVQLSTARIIAPSAFLVNFGAQLYGMFSSPNMKEIADKVKF